MSTTDIVPVDNMAALDTLDAQAREVAITSMLDQARTWLAHAVESTTPAQDIAHFKAFIATAAETAKRLKVSKEIQVDAEVMVRRSERALGQAIRAGQERGEIGGKANGPAGRVAQQTGNTSLLKPSPTVFASSDELSGNGAGIYAMTDDVTDAEFDEALDRAQDEQNVSRANVVRKVREVQSKTAPARPPAPPKYGVRRKHLQVLEALATSLAGIAIAVDEVTQLDSSVTAEEATRLTGDLSASIRSLNRLNNLLKERTK